jgi:hypothetical protein
VMALLRKSYARLHLTVMTRMPGGVAGARPNGLPLCRFKNDG